MEAAQHADSPIFLVGFMTAGKSTVGRLLAARLSWTFRDLDQVIEAAAGMSVSAIFAREGEAGFRRREAAAVRQALGWSRTVIATGGGAACEEDSLREMLAAARVVALDVAPAEIVRRAGSGAGRPLLDGVADPLPVVRDRLALREAFYARAHHRVDTNHRSAGGVASEILRWLGLEATGDPR